MKLRYTNQIELSVSNLRALVEDTVDADGFIVNGYTWWTCEGYRFRKVCGEEIRRYRGQSDVDCRECGACYNAGGQRLRDDWRGNRSNYDEDVSDMDGYEMQHAGEDY